MGIATINLNIRANFADYWRATAQAVRIGGLGCLVMDDPPMARAIKFSMGGGFHVVHRRFMKDDPELFRKINPPDAWLAQISGDAAGGLIIQTHNEPNVNADSVRDFNAWNIAALNAAPFPLAVGTFGVGNPSEKLIEQGAFDDLLRALKPTDQLMLHEYFQQHPTATPEYGWLCGRIEYWLERMKAIGCQAKTICLGEYGRDIGGGVDDGWAKTGWGAQGYATRLIDGLQLIYAPLAAQYGFNIYLTVFCEGTGGGWQNFDIGGQTAIYDEMEKWNRSQVVVVQPPPPTPPTQPPPEYWQPPVRYTVAAINGASINVRSIPFVTGSIRGSIVKGDVIEVSPNTWANGGHNWKKIYTRNGIVMEGYFASQYATLTPVTAPPIEPFKIGYPFDWNYSVTRRFGWLVKYNEFPNLVPHEGIDFLVSGGDQGRVGKYAVLAAADGIVEHVKDWAYLEGQGTRDAFVSGYGIRIIIRHNHGTEVFKTYYAHLSAPSVKAGDVVKKGDVIGVLGSTGNSSNPHIHFNLVWVGKGTDNPVLKDVVDPELYFEIRISAAS